MSFMTCVSLHVQTTFEPGQWAEPTVNEQKLYCYLRGLDPGTNPSGMPNASLQRKAKKGTKIHTARAAEQFLRCFVLSNLPQEMYTYPRCKNLPNSQVT